MKKLSGQRQDCRADNGPGDMAFAADLDIGEGQNRDKKCEIRRRNDAIGIGMDAACKAYCRRGNNKTENFEAYNIQSHRPWNIFIVLDGLEHPPEVGSFRRV